MRIELAKDYYFHGSGVVFDAEELEFVPLPDRFIEPWQGLLVSQTNPIGVSTANVVPFPFYYTDLNGDIRGLFEIITSGTMTYDNGHYVGEVTRRVLIDSAWITSIVPIFTGPFGIIKTYWDEATTARSILGKTLAELARDGFEIVGSPGHDTITALDVDGIVRGSWGDDTVIGGLGDDVIFGDEGADVLSGGTGSDTFAYSLASDTNRLVGARDKIVDFEVGVDLIDLALVDGNEVKEYDQAFSFREDNAFGHGIHLAKIFVDHQSTSEGEMTLVVGRLAGDRRTDFVIEMTGPLDLTAADFLL